MAGYTKQDTSNNIANGKVIDATDLDNEFDALNDAFDATTGHAHDGTAGDGGPILQTGPDQQFEFNSTDMKPKSGETSLDLGTNARKFDNIYVNTVKAGSSANTTINNNEYDVASGNLTFDVAGTITLNADGGDVVLADDTATYGSLTNSTGELVIKSGTTPTTALTFAGANATFAGTVDTGGVLTSNAGVVVDNITIDGTEIDLSSGDLTVDVAGDIILNADGGDVTLQDDATTYGSLTNSSGDLIIKSGTTTAATFSGANVTMAGTVTADSGVIVDSITIDGTEIDSSGALVLDSAGAMTLDSVGAFTINSGGAFTLDGASSLTLDSGSGGIFLQDSGVNFLTLSNVAVTGVVLDSSSDITLKNDHDAVSTPFQYVIKDNHRFIGIIENKEYAITPSSGSTFTIDSKTSTSTSGGDSASNFVNLGLSRDLTVDIASGIDTDYCSVIYLRVVQTGAYTITWDSGIYWAGGGSGPTITTGLLKVDLFQFTRLGGRWYGSIIGQDYSS